MFDPEARLDSGMKAGEAVKMAEAWWQRAGRYAMKKVANRERVGRKFLPASAGLSGGSTAILIQGEDVDVIPSGILRGLEWDQLTRREQLQVVKHWHHHFVHLPSLNPDEPRALNG